MINIKYIVELLILSILILYSETAYINTKQTQEESKKRTLQRRKNNKKGYIKSPKIKKRRRLDDDEDEDVEATSLVYDRCDNGHTPDDISDCTKYSTEQSSCCIFTYGQDTGCVLIGFKYLGTKSIGDMVVNCYCKYIGTFTTLLIFMLCLTL